MLICLPPLSLFPVSFFLFFLFFLGDWRTKEPWLITVTVFFSPPNFLFPSLNVFLPFFFFFFFFFFFLLFLFFLSFSFLFSFFLPPLLEELQAEWYQQNLLNEPKYGDITFQFDKKLVTAHSSVLSVRCGMLHKMYADAQPKKKKERKGTTNLVIAQPFAEQYPITSDTFELVLRYIYADDLQFETLSGRQVFFFLFFFFFFFFTFIYCFVFLPNYWSSPF